MKCCTEREFCSQLTPVRCKRFQLLASCIPSIVHSLFSGMSVISYDRCITAIRYQLLMKLAITSDIDSDADGNRLEHQRTKCMMEVPWYVECVEHMRMSVAAAG